MLECGQRLSTCVCLVLEGCPALPASDDFDQIKLRFTDPLQHNDRVIRLIVRFAETVAARSAQTNLERTSVGDTARLLVRPDQNEQQMSIH